MTDLILLVEDDDTDALLLERAMRKAKLTHELHRVDNGDAAVEYLSKAIDGSSPTPVVVLLDLKLPRRSGFEVLEWLRGHESALHRLPVVVLTSSAQDIDIDRAYDVGANSYLIKPGNPEGLQRIVENVHAYWLELNQPPSVSTAV